MPPKTKKLSSAQVKEVFALGRGFFGDEFSLIVLKQPLKGGFAVSVSSKAVKNAVIRNKTRRRIFSFLREHKVEEKNNACVFVVKKNILNLNKEVFAEKIKKLLKEAKIDP